MELSRGYQNLGVTPASLSSCLNSIANGPVWCLRRNLGSYWPRPDMSGLGLARASAYRFLASRAMNSSMVGNSSSSWNFLLEATRGRWRRDLVFRCRGGPRPSDRDLGLAVALIGRGGSHLLGPGGLGLVVAHKDWVVIDRMTYATMESNLHRVSERLKKKYNNLTTTKAGKDTTDTRRTVVNLSDETLSPEEITVLAKGGNYAVTPRLVPIEDITANIESGIRNLSSNATEEIRRETARVLQHVAPPKSNLSGEERKAIKTLNEKDNIVILAADKGNATVVLNTEDYMQKNSSIPTEIQRTIKKSEALPPRLYGLPKIHKQDVPLRPIVNAIGSPTYALAKYLSNLLKPSVGKTSSYIRDSSHFIEKIQTLKTRPGDIMVSFDVVSLFTRVPIIKTIDLLKNIFPEDIVALFQLVLTTTYFQWNGDFYEQTDGVAMGSPLSPMVANFYMESFEDTTLKATTRRPECWFRYVDDTFVVWRHGEPALRDFLNHLNGVHKQIQFTMELESDGRLPFLDVLVHRKPDGTLGHSVYRKPTHTDRYLHKSSNHHPGQKRAMMKTLIERAQKISEPQHLRQEMAHLRAALSSNGYSAPEIRRAMHPRRDLNGPSQSHTLVQQKKKGTVFLPYHQNVTDRIGKILKRHDVDTVFLPTQQVRNMLRSVKDKRDKLVAAGVYRIPCSCGAVYIGTTQRSVKTRLVEHERNCRLGQLDKSAVAEHAFQDGRHDIQFRETDILSNTSNYFPAYSGSD
ncbi:hypothetical protein ANN_25053 [Periplaneta americana]|uniref:Reverse transcriptase domain-containing protein n=1 Tax=Periplaneta americana TaxID=6978 RepID=A0ABQ8S0V9_PERAM|nr:hypothetical protein ANN_25053 [Periplaneta americana]